MESTEAGKIGILCSDDQPVFSTVASRLRDAGHTVRFFDPRSQLTAGQVDELSLLVNKQVFPLNLPALGYARRTGIPLWNDLAVTAALSSRLVGMRALETVGFHTPRITFEKPEYSYVAKPFFIWNGDPELNGDGDFYQQLIRTEPVDYKYYAVHDGSAVQTAAKCVSSKLYGPKRFLRRIDPHLTLDRRLRRLVDKLGVRGVGIDLVKDEEGRFWAVDINLAAGYRDCGLEPALCASISDRLSDGSAGPTATS